MGVSNRGINGKIDALEKQIFRHTAVSIAEELEINITRTAYSLLIQEAQDYCIALLTPDFQTYAHSEASIPIFVTDMGEPIRDAVNIIGVDRLRDGDVFVTNFGTGQHINNTMLGVPLFHGEKLAGYLAIRAHWADFGGLAPGGLTMAARHILQEGTRYRGLRIMRGGVIEPEVLATFRANTYQVGALVGDLMAQLAACMLGIRRWKERVAARWSAEDIAALTSAQLVASERVARKKIAAIPDGVYRATHYWKFSQDGAELDLHFVMKVTVDSDRLICDFSDMPPQTNLPINCGLIGGATAVARLAFRYLVDQDVIADSGFFAPVEVIAPECTLYSADADAPMGFWNAAIPIGIDLIIRAIAQANPDLAPAAHFASIGAVMLNGETPDGNSWRMMEGSLGGLGADHEGDGYGPVKVLLLGSMKSVPIEIFEGRFPICFLSRSLDRQAGGAGKYRGGAAVEQTYKLTQPATLHAYCAASDPAPGIAGGKPGKLGRTEIKFPDSEEWVAIGKSEREKDALPAGTLIHQVGGGGGGWGIPDHKPALDLENIA